MWRRATAVIKVYFITKPKRSQLATSGLSPDNPITNIGILSEMSEYCRKCRKDRI